MQRPAAFLLLLGAIAVPGCDRSSPATAADAGESRTVVAVPPAPPPVPGERAIPDMIASLQRLSRVDETAPFIPFVPSRSKAWLVGQRIEDLRALLAGEVARTDCQEGRCVAWMKSREDPPRALVFLERPTGWVWDPGASLTYQEPDPGAPDPENRDRTPEETFRSIPGNGPLVALLETDVGTLRCTLDERELPGAVATFVGLATGLRSHRDPATGEWVHRPCFGEQPLRPDRDNRGWNFHCPAESEEIGPGFWKADELRKGVGIDRPGRLAFDPPGPNRVGGRMLLSTAPDPERDGLVTVIGQCGPEEILKRLAAVVPGRRGAGSGPVRLKGITIAREEKASR